MRPSPLPGDQPAATAFRRPRLKRTIQTVAGPDGSIILMRTSANDVVLEHLTDSVRGLLAALDGTHPLEELKEAFGTDNVNDVLAQLASWHVVDDAADEDGLPDLVKERLDRQLRYFGDVTEGTPSAAECQARIGQARVAVLGTGGLGGRVALDLAAIGVGTIRIVDGDRIELSNLNRQTQYSEADIGRPKAGVLAERLRAFNSTITVEADAMRLEDQRAVADFIAGSTLVINAADWPPFEIGHWCNAACFEAAIPYISMSQLPPMMRVGPIYVPGQTGCLECGMARHRRDHPYMEEAIDQLRHATSPAATLGPTSGATASLVAMEVLHFITGVVKPAALGAAITIDTRTMAVEREPVVRDPQCRICGRVAA